MRQILVFVVALVLFGSSADASVITIYKELETVTASASVTGLDGMTHTTTKQNGGAVLNPRWTAQNPPLIDTSNPAICGRRPRPCEFYFAASSGRKSVWTLVRQLRGPHLRTCA